MGVIAAMELAMAGALDRSHDGDSNAVGPLSQRASLFGSVGSW